MMRRLRFILWIVTSIAVVMAGSLFLSQYPNLKRTLGPKAVLDVPFTLLAHDGRTLRQIDFRNRPTAWFFGFTH